MTRKIQLVPLIKKTLVGFSRCNFTQVILNRLGGVIFSSSLLFNFATEVRKNKTSKFQADVLHSITNFCIKGNKTILVFGLLITLTSSTWLLHGLVWFSVGPLSDQIPNMPSSVHQWCSNYSWCGVRIELAVGSLP